MPENYSAIIEGLALLAICDEEGLGGDRRVYVAGDAIFSGAAPDSVSRSVAFQLRALGWHCSDDGRWSFRATHPNDYFSAICSAARATPPHQE